MKINIGAYASTIDDRGNIWVSDVRHNALFKYNIDENEMECMGHFPGLDVLSKDIHLDAQFIENVIVFVPVNYGAVYLYEIEKNRFAKIDIPLHEDNTRYVKSIILNQRVYFASQTGNIFTVNVEAKQVNNEVNVYKEKALQKDLKYLKNCFVSSYRDGFVIYSKEDKKIGLFNLLKKKMKITNINIIADDIFKISNVDNRLYILYKDTTEILEYDIETGQEVVYKNKDIEWLGNTKMIPYEKVVMIGDSLYVLNMYSNTIFYLDTKKKEVCKLKDMSSMGDWVREEQPYGPMYSNVVYYNGKYYYIPCRSKKMLIIDRENRKYSNVDFAIDKRKYNYSSVILNSLYMNHACVEEGEWKSDLKDYLSYIAE